MRKIFLFYTVVCILFIYQAPAFSASPSIIFVKISFSEEEREILKKIIPPYIAFVSSTIFITAEEKNFSGYGIETTTTVVNVSIFSNSNRLLGEGTAVFLGKKDSLPFSKVKKAVIEAIQAARQEVK